MMQEESNWQPAASLEDLRARQTLLQRIRNFFIDRGYLEVETPIMAQFASTDVYLENIRASFRGNVYALQTSPEYHMKRLLAAGSGPIFQIAKVFRDDELGRWHNPEFTMLEWYRPGFTHLQLIEEIDGFLQTILNCPPARQISYQTLFEIFCEGINPHTAPIEILQSCLERYQLTGILESGEQDRDQYLFLLLAHVIEPQLAKLQQPVVVYDFPVSQAALARTNGNIAERFEVYFRGVELANGFHELCDRKIQEKRFEQDNEKRQAKGLSTVAIDTRLLAALDHGLPPCSGVALGIDRLIALALNKTSIQGVLTFPIDNA